MTTPNGLVLTEVFGPRDGAALRLKQAALVIGGILLLAAAAKIKVPMWPVPVTMGTFAVLAIGPEGISRMHCLMILALS